MGDTLNKTIVFTGVDIYNGGGAAVEVLNYTASPNIPIFFTPMLMLNDVNGAAANITVEIWFRYSMSDYALLYTTGAVAKLTDAATMYLWSYPDGVIAFIKSTAASISIRVSSSNSNDISISGLVWLLNEKRESLFDSTIANRVSDTEFDITAADDFQQSTDWYKHNQMEITDADTGTSAIRRIVAQNAGVRMTVDSPYPFTPASGDLVKMLKAYGHVDVNTVNGSTPISTGDIKDAMEVEGGMLESLDALTQAAGAGDLEAILVDTAAMLTTMATALSNINLDHLLSTAESGDVATNSVIAKLAAVAGIWNTFLSSTDSLQATSTVLTQVSGIVAGTVSIVQDILVDTETTLPAVLVEMQGASFNSATDSLKSIRDRGDAAWGAGTGMPRIED